MFSLLILVVSLCTGLVTFGKGTGASSSSSCFRNDTPITSSFLVFSTFVPHSATSLSSSFAMPIEHILPLPALQQPSPSDDTLQTKRCSACQRPLHIEAPFVPESSESANYCNACREARISARNNNNINNPMVVYAQSLNVVQRLPLPEVNTPLPRRSARRERRWSEGRRCTSALSVKWCTAGSCWNVTSTFRPSLDTDALLLHAAFMILPCGMDANL